MNEVKNSLRIDMPSETILALTTDKNRFGLSSMNELYNIVINNYVDESPVNMRNLVELKNIISEEVSGITSSQLRGIIDRVAINSIKELQLDNPGNIKSISIKPTYLSEEGFNTLNQICNVDHFSSMTKAIRNLLISYTKLTVLEREKIVFKKVISELRYAITNQLQVSITHQDKDYIIDPYLLIQPMDDFSNYLIAQEQSGTLKLFRVIKIKINKVIEYSSFTIPKNTQDLLQKIISNGIQVQILDSELFETLKKALNQDGNNEGFPNVINQIRGTTGNELKIRIK